MIFPRTVSPRRNAFTLTEMLVVMAVCSALVLLAMAVLQVTAKRGRSVQAQQHLRLIGAALFAYVAEHNGMLPTSAQGTLLAAGGLQSSRGPATAFWFNALDYYQGGIDHTVEGMKRAERPKWQQDPTKVYGGGTPRRHGLYGVAVGYGWNHQHFGLDAQASNAHLGWGTRLAQVERPAQTIIVGTGEDSENANNLARNTSIYANSIRCRRHEGGGYYLFLDGHIQKLTPEEVMADQSYLMRQRK